MSLPLKSLLGCLCALVAFNLSAAAVELLPYQPLTETDSPAALSPAPAESLQALDASSDAAAPKLESMLPAAEQAAPLNVDDIMVSSSETQPRNTPRQPETVSGSSVRQLNGTLVRRLSSFGPRYPIRLESESGKRIAYVDMSEIFISDLRPYLKQRVAIQGEVHPLVPGSNELVIVARTIRTLH